MPYEFKNAPPWGRSLKEYEDMFHLGSFKKSQKILGCADGPASFNYEASLLGHNVLSLDPIYELSAEMIKSEVAKSADFITNMVKENKEDYNWNYLFNSPQHLKECRLHNMDLFLRDYEKNSSRYVYGKLPFLPFKKKEFDLALVSNLLFLYDNFLDFNFHIKSVIELCRVASEVRVFPISSTRGGISQYVHPLTKLLKKGGHKIKVVKSNYTFIKTSSETLIVSKKIE